MKHGTVVVAAILAVAVLAGGAWGAMDMFLKIDGIEGESPDSKHKNEIDVLSWSWAIKHPATATGTGGGGATGKPEFSDLTVRKYVDKASPDLFLSAAMGEHIKSVVLTVRTEGKTAIDFFKMTLSDVLVTSVANGGTAADDRLLEDITLNYRKVEMRYVPIGPDGGPGSAIVRSYDLRLMKGL